MNPLQKIGELGQAVWLDDIHRSLLTSGRLRELIEQDGLRGLTSNPAIFKKAIGEGADYEEEISELKRQGRTVAEVFQALAVRDVQMAADEFRSLYNRTRGEHGYVSLEVNPHLAHYAAATVQEARQLWQAVNRPNVFIKVPATVEGLAAITQLLSEGINVNVTLIFGLPRYEEVAQAFIAGIEKRVQMGEPVDRVRSVASFFLSRVDALLDPRLAAIAKEGSAKAERARELEGRIAISSARLAYQRFQNIFSQERWTTLTHRGVDSQWLLWASTSTKNPNYSDVKYVEALIGPNTVNTMPMETLDAYRDHGQPEARLEQEVEQAQRDLDALAELGIDLDDASQQLENEGLEKFCKPYDEMLRTLEHEIVNP